jgi:general secretion pathway protein D
MKIRSVILAGVLAGIPLFAVADVQASSAKSGSDVDLGVLIENVARRTGVRAVIDPRVRAQVPLLNLDPNKLSYEDLLAILNVYQFAAIKQGDLLIVMPEANARQLPTPVYTDRNFKALPDEIVTMVLKVRNGCAPQMVPVLRPLMPQAAHMAAFPDTHTLILSDHAANVHRIVELVEALERNSPEGHECPEFPAEKK